MTDPVGVAGLPELFAKGQRFTKTATSMRPDMDGGWVQSADYDTLKADLEAERAAKDRCSIHPAEPLGLVCVECFESDRTAAANERAEAAEAKVAALQAQLAAVPPAVDIEQMREDLHATFNGGWRETVTITAFHQGIDTVCNVLRAKQEGKGTNGVLPGGEPSQPPVDPPA